MEQQQETGDTAVGTMPAHGGPVGTWQERFRLPEGEFVSTVHLTPGGRAFILRGPAPGGNGAGTWEPRGESGFVYRIAERLVDEDGAYAGWVDIDHRAELDGDTFTSSGTSTVYDAEDNLTVRVQVEASGSRV
ncbi:hypothetical protein [Streptomyces sp. NPDC094466]|uniref:hypothetical protein n=1 Tax=Streptomyces sp. NPDC094466 TaxID=3366065 RepID=UPI0037FB9D2A